MTAPPDEEAPEAIPDPAAAYEGDVSVAEVKDDDPNDDHVVKCVTSKGSMTIRVKPSWSPHGAYRFLELVKSGFFTHNVIYRVPPM